MSTIYDIDRNIDFIKVKKNKSGLNLDSIFNILAEKYEINNLMIEPGRKLSTILLSKNLLNDLVLYVCPKIIGKSGLSASSSINNLNSSIIEIGSIKKFSNDVRINYKFLRK
jgi:diaminohydroxyphosphoribosylaminopyrimidine deaminase/5-amino-6-(5-phosphoribosylamino)uracil reductase